VVINRIDARYASATDAHRRLPLELFAWLVERLKPLTRERGIGAVAIVPVSALGFGTTVKRPVTKAAPNALDLTYGECEWLLRPDRTPNSFNVWPLVQWTVQAALQQQSVELPMTLLPPQGGWIRELVIP